MVEVEWLTIGFWVSLIAALFILLHVPSCNIHWADRLGPFSRYLRKYHDLTLNLATAFAVAHIILIILKVSLNISI